METLERPKGIRRDQEIDGWRVRVYFWSRDTWLLAGIAFILLAISGAAGWMLRNPKPLPRIVLEGGEPEISLTEELSKAQPSLPRVFKALDSGSLDFAGNPYATPPADLIKVSRLPEETKQVALAYLDSVSDGDGRASADLLFYAHWVKPFRYANELVGELYRRDDDTVRARKYLEREIAIHGSASARERLVEMFAEKSDYAALSALSKDARYKDCMSLHTTIVLAAHEHRWRDLLTSLGHYEVAMWKPIPVLLATVAGIVWIIIALQAIQPQSLFCFRSIVPLLAVLAGMVSTWPTLFVVLWQEEVWNLRETGQFLPDFIFYVAGVGPREELIKLAFFLPFVPFLLYRGSRLEMLMVAGCVGLGFAIEENLQYFEQAGPIAAFGRFLTANFFHLSATGLIGLAFCDALRDPLRKTHVFLLTSFGVTLAHGLYDAFLAVAELQILGIISMIVFLLLALYFFRQLRPLRDAATDQLSIAATLVLGLALIVGVTFIQASGQLGFELAGTALAVNGISLIMVCYMFYWQLGEGMSVRNDHPDWKYAR